jgi:hypothetical protein
MKALSTPRAVALLALAVLMAATRYRHFASTALLPDASLAVFLLGGLYLTRLRWFALLFCEAALIDYLATAWGNVNDWCITPAYLFLVPAYGGAWLAGAWAARGFTANFGGVARTAAAFACGVALWFAVSNAGFYLFSGYFGEMDAFEYAARVARYLPRYAVSAAAYVLLAAGWHALWALARRLREHA